MPERQDFSGQTLRDPTGEFVRCRFSDTTLTGRIDVVLRECMVEKIILDQPEIVRFETPDTTLGHVEVNKRNIQPIHWLKTVAYLKHNHRFIAGRLREYARGLKGARDERLRNLILQSAGNIEERTGESWQEFLFSEPREVWALAEEFFPDLPDVLEHALRVRDYRWPELRRQR